MHFLGKLKGWARKLKSKLVVAHLASIHLATPWYAKMVLFVTLAYALSPIDLIPDFIPVLGILDDLIIVPAGIWIAFRMIPASIIQECISRAETFKWNKKKNRVMAVLIIVFWISIFAILYVRYADKFAAMASE